MKIKEAISILEERHIHNPVGPDDDFAVRINTAIDMAISALKSSSEWNYVETDGNPNEIGTYFCCLVSQHELESGKVVPFYEFDNRWFGDAESDVAKGWIMDGQPDHGLVWTEETGSREGERVYAWKELPTTSDMLVDPEGFGRLLKEKK